MSVWAVGMVRDERDVIATWVRHLLDEVDHVHVADNRSTDGTREILAEVAKAEGHGRLTIEDDPEIGYYQSRKVSRLAEVARAHGATWVLACDADEVWYSRQGRIREALAALPPWHAVVKAPIYDHRATALDPAGDDPFRTMEYRERQPLAYNMWKVAFRPQEGAVVHQGNHGVDLPEPGQVVNGGEAGVLEIRHFPIRSPGQMTRKTINGATAYAATDLPENVGAHWRDWHRLIQAQGPDALAEVFRTYWWKLSPIDAGMVHDPAPVLRWRTET